MSADCTIQDVFNRFYPEYTKTHELSAAQRKAAYHIRNCKTGAFGVNVSVCEECGCISVAAPCARSSQRKNGWMPDGKMYWMHHTSMWSSLSRKN